jgi:hypothetical protein
MPALSEPPDDAVLGESIVRMLRGTLRLITLHENFLIAMLTAMKNEPYVFCKVLWISIEKRYRGPRHLV